MTLLNTAVALLILASSIWVLIDASILGIQGVSNKPAWKKGFLEYGPIGSFVVCLLCWIVGFPAYLVRRRRHLAKALPPQETRLEVECPHCRTGLVLSSGLFGRVVACPSCQRQFTAPGIPAKSWYHGSGPTVVGWGLYPVVVVASAILLSQFRIDDLLRGRATRTTATLELKIRKSIQERLAKNPATANTEIKQLTLVRQTENRYQGTLVAQAGGRTEENDVVVTLEGRQIKWQLLPRYAAEGSTLEWNLQEPDALKNGNVAVALQKILRNPDCRTDAVAQAPALVLKKLPEHYGKLLKLSGKVYLINTLSAESAFGKALGGKPGAEILFICGDKTVVDMLCTNPNPKVKSGDSATVFGFAIGTTQVPNPAGGVVTRLVLVGSECELASSR